MWKRRVIDSFTNLFNSELLVWNKVLYSMARGTDKTDKNSGSHGTSVLVGETGIKQICTINTVWKMILIIITRTYAKKEIEAKK